MLENHRRRRLGVFERLAGHRAAVVEHQAECKVDAYDRRIQSAISIQGRKMQRRAEFLLARALRRARLV